MNSIALASKTCRQHRTQWCLARQVRTIDKNSHSSSLACPVNKSLVHAPSGVAPSRSKRWVLANELKHEANCSTAEPPASCECPLRPLAKRYCEFDAQRCQARQREGALGA